MKKFRNLSVTLCLGLQLIACGGSSSKKGNSRPAPPQDNTGLIDTTTPANVDLIDHMVFDRLVSATNQNNLRKDLARIERFDLDTGTSNDQALQNLINSTDLKAGTMSEWLKQRVRFIINEDLSKYRLGAVRADSRSYEVFRLSADQTGNSENTAAAMIGTALYAISKKINAEIPEVNYLMININNSWVHANTQRNGVMQIGPALFDPRFQPNPSNLDAYTNTAIRVETLFHEARHADGNAAAGSLGFTHINCPAGAGISKELVGQPACDSNANGPYTLGYRVLKAYAAKCGSLCSVKDKSMLDTFALDSLTRVVNQVGGSLPVLDEAPEAGFEKIDISAFSLAPSTLR